MRKLSAVLFGLLIALGSLVMTSSPAAAAQSEHLPVAPWAANGESQIIDATTVKLQDHINGDTSVENPSVGLNVQSGDTISVQYELMNDATCETGEPRLFAIINGSNNKSSLCDSTGDSAASGVLSFQAASSGLVTQVGLVYSRDVGHVIMRELTIAGTLVLFQEQPASPSPTPSESESPQPTPSAAPSPSESAVQPTPTQSAAGKPGLPVTGTPVGIVAGAGVGLAGLGTLLYFLGRKRRHPTTS